MIKLTAALFLFFTGFFYKEGNSSVINNLPVKDSIPAMLLGNFKDDYDISYYVNDSLWIQYPASKYHILKWNTKEQYLVAKNDDKNPGEGAGLYTRIDYMLFNGMEPYRWGFCLTVYDAKTDSIAEIAAMADRQNPKNGCNGFPFSRMKKAK
jgi:hypothetical protein